MRTRSEHRIVKRRENPICLRQGILMAEQSEDRGTASGHQGEHGTMLQHCLFHTAHNGIPVEHDVLEVIRQTTGKDRRVRHSFNDDGSEVDRVGGRTNVLVCPRSGDMNLRMTHQDPVGNIKTEVLKQFSSSGPICGSRAEKIRDIGSEFQSQFLYCVLIDGHFPHPRELPEHCCGIGTSASETCTDGNPFPQMDCSSAICLAATLQKHGSFVSDVCFTSGDVRIGACHLDNRGLLQLDLVEEIDGVKDGLNIVEAVLSPVPDNQSQIDFCVRPMHALNIREVGEKSNGWKRRW